MGWFGFGVKKRGKAEKNQSQQTRSPQEEQTFILEPILTPSGLVDGTDETPDPLLLDLDAPPLPEVELAQTDLSHTPTNPLFPDTSSAVGDVGEDYSLLDSSDPPVADSTALPVGIADAIAPESISGDDLEPISFIHNTKPTTAEADFAGGAYTVDRAESDSAFGVASDSAAGSQSNTTSFLDEPTGVKSQVTPLTGSEVSFDTADTVELSFIHAADAQQSYPVADVNSSVELPTVDLAVSQSDSVAPASFPTASDSSISAQAGSETTEDVFAQTLPDAPIATNEAIGSPVTADSNSIGHSASDLAAESPINTADSASIPGAVDSPPSHISSTGAAQQPADSNFTGVPQQTQTPGLTNPDSTQLSTSQLASNSPAITTDAAVNPTAVAKADVVSVVNPPTESTNAQLQATTELAGTEEATQSSVITDPNKIGLGASIISSSPTFTSGVFTVGTSGIVSFDYLFDGGGYQGELAIFSLEGMEQFEPSSAAFIQEAASRAASNSELGHVAIADRTEGARFGAAMPWESNMNSGTYQGVKTFSMRPGDTFGVMLVPNGTVQQVLANPSVGGALRPLFSLGTSNPFDGFHLEQMVDVTGDGSTFAMEDLRLDSHSDKDYNDIIFQVRGATGQAVRLEQVIAPGRDWRGADVGKELIAYVSPEIIPNAGSSSDTGVIARPDTTNPLEVNDANPDAAQAFDAPRFDATSTPPPDVVPTDASAADAAQNELTSSNSIPTEHSPQDSTSTSTHTPVADTVTYVTPESLSPKETDSNNPLLDEDPAAVPQNIIEVSKVTEYTSEPIASSEVTGTTATNAPTQVATVAPTLTSPTVSSEVIPTETTTLVDSPFGTVTTHTDVASTTETNLTPAASDAVTQAAATVDVNQGDSSAVDINYTSGGTERGSTSEISTLATNVPVTATEINSNSSTVANVTQEVISSSQTDSTLMPVAADLEVENPTAATAAFNQPESVLSTPLAEQSGDTATASPTEAAATTVMVLVDTVSPHDQSYTTPAPGEAFSVQPTPSVAQQAAFVSNPVPTALDSDNGSKVASTSVVDYSLQAPATTDLAVAAVAPTANTLAPAFDFPVANQPLVGVIDTGFSANNPDIDYSRITLGRDYVASDDNPLLAPGEGSTHGTQVLDVITAKPNNGIGIDGINDTAPIWLGRAIGSGRWADSLVEFVNAAKESNQPNAVVNLSFDLTSVQPDGTVTTRYELTPAERAALQYAKDNQVLVVAGAGNQGGTMSALGQASKEFDNIITVGAADGTNRAAYSSFGAGLDLLASGSTDSFTGTSRAAAEVTGAVSQVWAANPQLSYQQVKNILLQTATDLSAPGWDDQTGFGLLSLAAAVELAKATTPEAVPPVDKPVAQELPKASESPNLASIPASDEPGVLPGERPADSYSYSYSNSGDGYSSSYSYTGNYTGDWNAGTSDYSSRSESSSNYSSGSDGYSYNSRSRSLSTSESHSDWNPSRSRYNSSSDYSNTSSSSSQYNSNSNGYSYTSSSSSSSSSSGDSQWEGEYSRVSYEGRSHGEGSYRSSYDSNSSSESSYPDGSGYVSTSSSSSDSVTQWTSSWDNNSGSRYTSTTTQTSWYYWYSLYYWAGGYRWSWQLTSTSSQSGYRDGQYWSTNPVTSTLSDSGEIEYNDDFFEEDDDFDSGSGGDDSNEGGSGDDKSEDKCLKLLQEIVSLGTELRKRYEDLLIDDQDLYNRRRFINDPSVSRIPPRSGRSTTATGDPGSWEGHQKKYLEVQKKLQQKIDEFKKFCNEDEDPWGYEMQEAYDNATHYAEEEPPQTPLSINRNTLLAQALQLGAVLRDNTLLVGEGIGKVALAILIAIGVILSLPVRIVSGNTI